MPAGVATKISNDLAAQTQSAAPASDASALKLSGGDLSTIEDNATRQKVMDVLTAFAKTPREQIRQDLGLAEKVLFLPDPEAPGALIRIDPDGTRTKGRREGRNFVPSA